MPRNNAPFPGGPGSPWLRQSTPRCSAAPIWRPVGASHLLGPSGLYVHYIRTYPACQEVFAMMPPPSNLTTAAPGTRDAPDEVGSSHAAGTSVAESTADAPIPWTPSRRSTASWVVYDLGDTVFQQTMITNYFPVWVVAVMGGADGHISLVNTVTMLLMFGVGPWIGAVSDHLPRRVPLLIITVTGCCLLTFFVGGNLWTSLALFLGANLFFQAGVVVYDALLPAVSTPANRGRVGASPVV